MTDRFSDELLNAYVDGELDAGDRRWIEEAMEQDAGLLERVEELQGLKRLVASAYDDVASPHAEVPHRTGWSTVRVALAASVAAFALGIALTWGLLSYTGGTPATRIVEAPGVGSAPEAPGAVKVLFHLNRDDPARLSEILTEAEALLTASQGLERPTLVRIVATGSGLSLFEENAPDQALRRVRTMKKTHDSQLFFNGCGVAYEQLKRSAVNRGFELIPEIQLVDLGVLELMRRQREGWAYIRL